MMSVKTAIPRSIFRIVLAAALFTINIPAFADNTDTTRKLPEFKAVYTISKYGIDIAEATYKLKHTDKGYKFTQHTKLIGIASLLRNDTVSASSDISQTSNGLLLTQFKYVQTGEEKNRNEDFTINWQRSNQELNGEIKGVVRGKPIDLKVKQPVWEALSFQIPMMLEANEKTAEYRYYALLTGELDTYFFKLTTSKTLSFAGKKYHALELVRKDPKKDRELRIWIIPELHNIPAVVENMRDGKQFSLMEIKSVKFDHDTLLSNADQDTDDF
jgi:hypothetical protein